MQSISSVGFCIVHCSVNFTVLSFKLLGTIACLSSKSDANMLVFTVPSAPISIMYRTLDKIGIKRFCRFLLVAPWPKTSKASLSRTNQTAKIGRKQTKHVKISLNFTKLHKARTGENAARNFPNFLKKSTLQMFGYPCLDARCTLSHGSGELWPLQ